jgi:hypothetical protein
VGAGTRRPWAVAARLPDEYRAARYNGGCPTAQDIAEVEFDGSPLVELVPAVTSAEPFDVRCPFDAIASAVRRIGLDPVDGHLCFFLNKRPRAR